MGMIPISVPQGKPVNTRTHDAWVRVLMDTGMDGVKSIHGLPVSITSPRTVRAQTFSYFYYLII